MTNNFTQPCGNEHVIKQWVDECTGKFIDPITVTDAVITKHGKTLTEVLDLIFGNLKQNKDLLNALKIRVDDLDTYKAQFQILKAAFDTLNARIQNNEFATKNDLNCLSTQLNAMLESVRHQLEVNQSLFTQLLSLIVNGQGSELDPSDINIPNLSAYVLRSSLEAEIDELNKFAKRVKSELDGGTYPSASGTVTLPPTVGGALYVASVPNAIDRFSYSLYGDVNQDGAVTAADVMALYDYMLDQTNGVSGYNYDITGDGNITSSDLTKVYDVLLGTATLPPSIHDKVTGKTYQLPAGTIFVNDNRVYCVKSTNQVEMVGRLYEANGYSNVTYNVSQSPSPQSPVPAVDIEDQTIDDNESTEIEVPEAVKDDYFDNVEHEHDSKVFNVYMIASKIKSINEDTDVKARTVATSIDEDTFSMSILNYNQPAANIKWIGFQQNTAQGIAIVKTTWGTTHDIQYIQPLGSFNDFRRFFHENDTKFVDILLYGDSDKYNSELIRFQAVDPSQIAGTPFSGNEDYTLIAGYTPSEGTPLYFLWDGRSNVLPVVIPQADLADYLTSIDYQ